MKIYEKGRCLSMKKSLSLILALAVLATICLSGFGVQAEDISVLRAKVIPYAEIDQAMVVNDSIPVPEADRGKVKGEVKSGYAPGIPHYTDGYNLELVDSPIGFFEETQVLQCDTPVERAVEIDSLTYPTSYTAYPPFNMMFLEESLDGVQEIMFYVKMPAGKENCIGFTLCIMANGEIVYPLMDIWKPFYYLEKGTTNWVKSQNVNPRSVINLEEGFEGYIRIPLSSFNNNIKSWKWDEDGAILRRIQVTAPRNFGGDAGPWYISPLMLCTNSVDTLQSADVVLEGEEITRNLFNGRYSRPVAADSSVASYIEPNNTEYLAGDTAMVTVTPPAGYQLKSGSLTFTYTLGGVTYTKPIYRSDDGEVFSFTMPDASTTINAEFVNKSTAMGNLATLGAQCRNAQGEITQGLRFISRMYIDNFDFGTMTAVMNGDTYRIIEFGTLILPTDMLGGGELDLDTPQVAKVTCTCLFDRVGDYVDFAAVLTNIPEGKYNREFTARPYLTVQKDGEQTTFYYDAVSKSVNGVGGFAN